MKTSNPFLNKAGRLRSGWRLGIFVVAFTILAALIEFAIVGTISLIATRPLGVILAGFPGFVVQAFVLLSAATLVGWGCGALLEGLPLKALGWATHRRWLRDFAGGSIIGGLSLIVAALVGMIGRGFHFSFNSSSSAGAIGTSLLISALVFIVAAAGEEALFRGYPLQTLTRARLAWLGIMLTSLPFAAVHLSNPNVVRGVTFANTALAGVWLAAAYLRTRSLWFPLGVHWSWNWTMGSVLGLPVSGITQLSPAPLARLQDTGPAWLTGGAYGPEGGAVCTIALVFSLAFIWWGPWFRPAEEMLKFTAEAIEKEEQQGGSGAKPPFPTAGQPE